MARWVGGEPDHVKLGGRKVRYTSILSQLHLAKSLACSYFTLSRGLWVVYTVQFDPPYAPCRVKYCLVEMFVLNWRAFHSVDGCGSERRPCIQWYPPPPPINKKRNGHTTIAGVRPPNGYSCHLLGLNPKLGDGDP